MTNTRYNPSSLNRKSSAVVVQPHGGLGNQLFMYFAALYFSQKYEKNLYLDFPKSHKSFHSHNGSIQEFALQGSSSWGSELELVSSFESVFSRLLELNLMPVKFRNWLGRRITFFQSFNLGYSSGLEFASSASRIGGYYQTYRYFDKLIPESKDLQFDKYLGGYLYESLKHKLLDTNSVALHVRRGDYQFHKNTYGLLSREYYAAAIMSLRSFVEVKEVYVFTDSEVPLGRDYFEFEGVDINFVDTQKQLTAADTLRLMTFSKHHIIANSSFSWWGQN